jgi:hypothetical protein
MTIVVQKAGASGGGGPVLQPVGTIATRPALLSGALQTFVETTLENTIRSQADDNQVVKVRRRATNVTRTADATMVLKADLVEVFRQWYRDICAAGSLPTRFKIPPDCGVEQVWRFAAPPQYDWSVDGHAKACRVSMKLEQMPNWVGA